MPFKTCYRIYSNQKTAPVYTGYDKTMAFVTWEDLLRNLKGNTYYMEQAVEPVGELTKSEEYLMLVYDVRRHIKKYYNGGRKQEDLKASLELEASLDKWNKRTQAFIASHPGYKPQDQKSFAFCQLVTEWRKVWHERMGYRKRTMGFEQQVLNEMSKKCYQLEKEIDKYIKQELQLL